MSSHSRKAEVKKILERGDFEVLEKWAGEILVNVPVLIQNTADLLPSFLKGEPFEQGTHPAIYRVASVDSKSFLKSAAELSKSVRPVKPHKLKKNVSLRRLPEYILD